MYTNMKVFDVTDFPETEKRFTYDYFCGKQNDIALEYSVGNSENILDEFLLKNGCKKYEDIIIKYWW